MGEFSPFHWLVVLAIVVLLFGGKKIPEVMRGLGEGIREFQGRHARRRARARADDASVSSRRADCGAGNRGKEVVPRRFDRFRIRVKGRSTRPPFLFADYSSLSPAQFAQQRVESRQRQSHELK